MDDQEADKMQYAMDLGMAAVGPARRSDVAPFKSQLLKWIGNKQKFAHEIISYFPADMRTYREPFLGAGGVLATLAPRAGVGTDAFGPLVEIWQALRENPERLKGWYRERWEAHAGGDPVEGYERIKASYNASPNGADLLFLSRSCYGGVVRFRKADGYMSTPCGPHRPISPASFDHRVDEWGLRVRGSKFRRADFAEAMAEAERGDVVYCDPPYSHSQAILYGAQAFDLSRLMDAIADCKERGVRVVLSIDGTKKSGDVYCDVPLPDGLFEHELLVNVGRSMLRRFQMGGQTLEAEEVRDRLLLTY